MSSLVFHEVETKLLLVAKNNIMWLGSGGHPFSPSTQEVEAGISL